MGTIEIPEPPKTMQEDESISIYDRIKRSALKRFSKGHNNYTRYCDLAMKFFMGKSGAKAGKPKVRTALKRAEAKAKRSVQKRSKKRTANAKARAAKKAE